MLANLFTAVEMANSSVPATAPADFQAGIFMGYYKQNVQSNMRTCYGEDQKSADAADQLIADIKAKDWAGIQAMIKEFTADVKPKVDNCDATDPLVHSMYDNEADTVEDAKNDPDW